MVFERFLKSRWLPLPNADESKCDELAKESFLHSELQHPELQHSFPDHPRVSRRYTVLSHAATFFIAVLLSTTVVIVHRQSLFKTTSGPITKHLHCGNSTAEARANGCVYDLLANMWIPEPCWDKEGTDEFILKAEWQGYDTGEGKRLLSVDEMSERLLIGEPDLVPDPNSTNPPYYSTYREHSIHCALSLQSLHRRYLTGNEKKLDIETASYDHTLHCTNLLLRMAGATEEPPWPLDKLGTRTWAGLSGCEIEV